MDHKVSKDMISSGMIPSGEKTQADLSRTQYGSAPSPSKLMDAYKSMYDKKEEVINEMKMGDVSGSADFASRNIKGAKGAAPVPKKETGITPYKSKETGITPYKSKETGITPKTPPKPETKSMIDRLRDRKQEVASEKDAKRDRLKKIMADNESVDLLAAYHSIYEHHQKDKDGNTIPHEDEKVNEGKIPAGLQAYLDKKKGKKEDKKEMKEGLATAAKMALGLVKNMAKKKVVQDIGRGAATQLGAQAVGSMMNSGGGQQKQKTGTVSASADLFDIVKGKLLDEGLSEEEIRDIMLTLTPDEIMNEMNQGPSTPVSVDDVEFPKPGKKVMPRSGATYIGKVRPKPGFKMNPNTAQLEKEEYKNFDPKKPDPKQMAAQAKQEKNRQKFNDPMGVKNKNIGGQGLDPMDK